MFNTIILVIIAIIFAIYMFRVIDSIEDNNLHISDILVFVLCLVIIIGAKSTDKMASGEIAEAYHNGYMGAIKSAQLIEVNDDGYKIQFGTFGNEVHEYSFD